MTRPPTPTTPPRRGRLAAAALLAIVLSLTALTACGTPKTDSASGKDDDVASLDTGSKDSKDSGKDSTSGGSKDDATDAERQDAMLKFAKCMREQGIDMADPTFDADGKGGVSIGVDSKKGDGPPTQIDEKKMDAADKKCQHFMDDVMGDAPQMSPEEQAKFRDQQLDYAKCMREHDIDMADPQIEFDGNKTKIMSGGPGKDAPHFDPESAKFKAANEACQSKLGEGRIGTGPAIAAGGPSGGASTNVSGGGK
jgi:hypothetical protein